VVPLEGKNQCLPVQRVQSFGAEPTICKSLLYWWARERKSKSASCAARNLAGVFWEFLRESTPERRRRRYGDAEYDWERRANTTSGGVGARSRFLGLLHSEYQPIEPEIFREIMARLEIEFKQFTFVDIGSGKGRALLLAAEYPFRRIIGVELLPELHEIAKQNVAQDGRIELRCGDAAEFTFPLEPLVIYLFNPLPEAGTSEVVEKLQTCLREFPRPAYVIYVNPVYEQTVFRSFPVEKIGGTHQYSLFRSLL
jgi:SAM-dependent methyltransferase